MVVVELLTALFRGRGGMLATSLCRFGHGYRFPSSFILSSQAKHIFWQSRDMSTASTWGYTDTNGPEVWPEMFPQLLTADGQSPTRLDTEKITRRRFRYPLVFNYGMDCAQTVENDGHSMKVSGIPHNAYVSGGPLGQKLYRFHQFHLHWGSWESNGSEHIINGRQYSAEIHIVNWNSINFTNPQEASNDEKSKGLCVLGIMVDASPDYLNNDFRILCDNASQVAYPNMKTLIKNPLDVNQLLPTDPTRYYYYRGSLTTPPFTESVRWIVFRDPILVNIFDLEKLYCLQSGDGSGDLVKNFRPPQPLNDRVIWRSFSSTTSNRNCPCEQDGSSDSDYDDSSE